MATRTLPAAHKRLLVALEWRERLRRSWGIDESLAEQHAVRGNWLVVKQAADQRPKLTPLDEAVEKLRKAIGLYKSYRESGVDRRFVFLEAMEEVEL